MGSPSVVPFAIRFSYRATVPGYSLEVTKKLVGSSVNQYRSSSPTLGTRCRKMRYFGVVSKLSYHQLTATLQGLARFVRARLANT